MKKKTIIVLFLCMITLVFTGCDNKKVNKEKEYETIEIKDEKTGYTTTFKYEKGKDYKITDTETDGKYVKVEMEAKSLNLEVEMYYFDITNIGWNNNIESRKNSEGYQEFTWNVYKGYIYKADDTDLYFNILLKDGGNESMSICLFGDVDAINYNKGKVTENFTGEEFQKFMNTIEFKEKQ